MSFLMVQRAPITTGTVVVLSPHIRSTLCIIIIIMVLIIVIVFVIILESKMACAFWWNLTCNNNNNTYVVLKNKNISKKKDCKAYMHKVHEPTNTKTVKMYQLRPM